MFLKQTSTGKFALNLSQTLNDQMIVPYNCPYAFILRPKREFMPLLRMPEIEDLAEQQRAYARLYLSRARS
jgi:hypothetical protein